MGQVDDELAIRAVLADMTAGQPPGPPNRYGAIRRRAVLHRRRTLAGAAAAVAILVLAAIAIPLGLLHVGPHPPQAPRHYRISVLPPGPGAQRDLIASGVLDQHHWQALVQLQKGNELCFATTYAGATGIGWSCSGGGGPVLPPASATGYPTKNFGGQGTGEQVDIGTVRSDVSYLKIAYNDGQVLTAHPVAVFGRQYARYFAMPAPSSTAVTRITAYSAAGELGYTIPFTAGGSGITLGRWLRPGEPALPHPARYTIGSGTMNGSGWHDYVYVGPWGTCFAHPTGVSNCFAQLGWLLPARATAGQIGFAHEAHVAYYYGEARPSVQYLMVTTAHGSTARVMAVAAGSRKFYAFASTDSDPVVRWVAYDAAGQQLASGNVHY